MKLLSPTLSHLRHSATGLMRDRRGVAATEFALIVPIMLVLFFGTVEISSAVAIDRKVTLVARTLSDLTSQMLDSVTDTDLKNAFAAAASILTPYAVSKMKKATISEIFIDGNKIAKIQWSKTATVAMVNGAPEATYVAPIHKANDTVSVPDALLVPNTYLIWSEVEYDYTPTIGYVLKDILTLDDETYTRPRQSACIDYPPPSNPANACTPVS
jgi:Flp pilus assembly protein TadG